MTAEWILAQVVADQAVETVEPLAHVDGIECEVDLGGGANAEHATRPRRCGSAAPDRRRGSSRRSRFDGHCAKAERRCQRRWWTATPASLVPSGAVTAVPGAEDSTPAC